MKKKSSMTKDEAKELYKDFQIAMSKMKSDPATKAAAKKGSGDVAKQIAKAISAGMRKDDGASASSARRPSAAPVSSGESGFAQPSIMTAARFQQTFAKPGQFGKRAAFTFFIVLAAAKLGFVAIEGTQILSVQDANAKASFASMIPARTKGERIVLKKLDERRAELEERERVLDQKEGEIKRKDRAFASKLVEIRELTEKLKQGREQKQRKRDSQLDQLANVYGSMNPNEASGLMEQLDVTIALALLERMPEKRIGQILSLMSPERALTLTRMLSGS